MAGILLPDVLRSTAPSRPAWLGRQVTGFEAHRNLTGWNMALRGQSVPGRSGRTELSYDAARPSLDRQMVASGNLLSRDSSRYQRDRVQMAREARHVADNIGFAAGLKMMWQTYLFSTLSYEPDTGDSGMDSEVADYVEMWMDQADARLMMPFATLFGLTFTGGLIDCDAGLIFVDDGDMLRLMPVEFDQIGEINSASIPELNYVAGRFLNADGTTAGWRVYSRTGDMMYSNPQVIPAQSFVYLADPRNVTGARSITCLATLIDNLKDKQETMNNVKVAIKDQTSKSFATYTARGEPPADMEASPSFAGPNGRRLSSYLTHANNAVTEYFGMGEQMEVLENKHLNENSERYFKTIDREDCMGVNLPYGFVVDEADTGGAGVRIVAHKAGREFTRMIESSIRRPVKRIFKTAIGYAADKGDISQHPNLSRDSSAQMPSTTGYSFGPPRAVDLYRGALMFPPPPTADMERESRTDLAEIGGGLNSRTEASAPYGGSPRRTFAFLAKEARMRRDVAAANGVTPDEVFLINPSAATAPPKPVEPEPNGTLAPTLKAPPSDNTNGTPAPVKLSAHLGDTAMDDLPPGTQDDIDALMPGLAPTMRLPVYGMTVPELVAKADPHNLATARANASKMTRVAAGDDVRAKQATKHILINSDKIVDGHHHLAKAERGKITNSLRVVDLTPARLTA